MNYQKPLFTKIDSEELKKIIKLRADSRCGNAGCEGVWAGNLPHCTDVYHDTCLDENNWSLGECKYGSWLDSVGGKEYV